ncbi:MAG: hypothetical protein QME49_05075 [bacterium]|nr:hypothetical protein [bacterium]
MQQVLICLVVCCLGIVVEAAESPYASVKFGIGARSIGLGHGFVAIADDASSIYWNPAGLGQLDKKELAITAMNINADSPELTNKYIGISGVCPWPFKKNSGAIGIGIMQVSVDDIKKTGIDGYGEMIQLGSFDSQETTLLVSYGKEILRDMLYAGGNMKFFSHKLGDYSGDGLGVDVGVIINISCAFNRMNSPLLGFMNDMKIGLILSSNLPKEWDTGHKDEDALNGTLAIAVVPLKTEAYRLNAMASLSQVKKRPMSFSTGCEFICLSLPVPVSFWSGIDNAYLEQRGSAVDTSRLNYGKRLSLGIGARYKIIRVDYTVSLERFGARHKVSTGIAF